MVSKEQKRHAIGTYLAAHTAGDIDTIVGLFAQDALAWDPVDAEPHVGIDDIRAFFTGTHEMADSLELVRSGPIRCAGKWAAFPMTVKTRIGELRLELDVIDVMTFDDDGRITEMKAYWDMEDARTSSV